MKVIRKAKPSDVEKLHDLLTKLIQDERKYDKNIDEHFIVTNSYEEKIQKENHFFMVLEEEGSIQGFLYGYLEDFVTKSPVAHLDALYINPSFQNQGHATSMIQEFKDWCKKHHASSIEVNVLNENKAAYHLYIKEGFLPFKSTLKQEL